MGSGLVFLLLSVSFWASVQSLTLTVNSDDVCLGNIQVILTNYDVVGTVQLKLVAFHLNYEDLTGVASTNLGQLSAAGVLTVSDNSKLKLIGSLYRVVAVSSSNVVKAFSTEFGCIPATITNDMVPALPAPKFENLAVTSSKIADGTVSWKEFADQGILGNDIGTNEVTTDDIAEGGITSFDIALNSVTTGMIASNSIGAGQLGDASVSRAKIANGQV
jgi:hypothetical protein